MSSRQSLQNIDICPVGTELYGSRTDTPMTWSSSEARTSFDLLPTRRCISASKVSAMVASFMHEQRLWLARCLPSMSMSGTNRLDLTDTVSLSCAVSNRLTWVTRSHDWSFRPGSNPPHGDLNPNVVEASDQTGSMAGSSSCRRVLKWNGLGCTRVCLSFMWFGWEDDGA